MPAEIPVTAAYQRGHNIITINPMRMKKRIIKARPAMTSHSEAIPGFWSHISQPDNSLKK
jgi:hypothetical protein